MRGVLVAAAGCALAAVGSRPASAAHKVAIELSGQGGLGVTQYPGDANWAESTPSVGIVSLGVRAERWVFALTYASLSSDTLYHGDPSNGGRLLIGLNNVSQFTESMTTRFLLFSLRGDVFTTPHVLNPYGLVGIGTGRLTDRVNGGTRATSITNSAGRGAMTVAVGLETRPWTPPSFGRLSATAFLEGRYLTRTPTGDSARRGYIARADEDYTSANNYYMARDNSLDEVDAPPERLSHVAVTLGLKVGFGL